jgi:hypothetical protein
MNTDHLNGLWTYRSFNNVIDMVGDDKDKALALIFGEGNLTIQVQKNNPLLFNAVLDFGGGAAMDLYGEIVAGSGVNPATLIITGAGREGTSTAKWVYQYKGYVVPQWAEGVQQVTAIIGTVIRTLPHAGGNGSVRPPGVVASFTMLKH